MLHVGSDLAFASGQTQLIPPRIRRVDETGFLLVVFQILLTAFLHLFGLKGCLAFGRNQQDNILVDGKQHSIQETIGEHFLQHIKHLRGIIVFHFIATLVMVRKGEHAFLLYQHRLYVDVAQIVMLLRGLAQRHFHEGASSGGFGHAVQEFFNVFGHR